MDKEYFKMLHETSVKYYEQQRCVVANNYNESKSILGDDLLYCHSIVLGIFKNVITSHLGKPSKTNASISHKFRRCISRTQMNISIPTHG